MATVSTIGLVTITGALGDRFGGLGFFIFEGYRRSFPTEILFGAIPAMLLAIAVDLVARRRPAPAHAVVATRGRRRDGVARRASRPDARPAGRRPDGDRRRGRRLADRPGPLDRAVRDPGARSPSTWRSAWPPSLIAIAIALPDRALDRAHRRGDALAVNVANIGRAIPSLALIGDRRADHACSSTPSSGSRSCPTLIAMIALGDPADPRQRPRGHRGRRPRPDRGRDAAMGLHEPARCCAASSCRWPPR